MLGFADLGQAVEAAAELDDSAAFTQGVERVGVHSERDQIASAQQGISRSVQERQHSAAFVRLSIGFMALPRNQLRLRRDARNQLIQPS
jgi:hypothetical protein